MPGNTKIIKKKEPNRWHINSTQLKFIKTR